MIELDAGAIGFVRRIKREGAGWIFLKRVVQEEHLILAEPTGEKRIPELPDRAPHEARGEEVVDQGHEGV
jgi:hypothetical protein